ncbi:glucosyl-3-phosphoglycerate synthase [Amycolatopsis sp. NPDC049688]|uniref:glucosyl-3-phosphoglycerate synthase n=1 Tax=Amycolatopsis sp. NPDC049688 TaxID=3154733 RepID=UPI00344127B3
MRADVRNWFHRRTYRPRWSPAALAARKEDLTISVVLPALNEQETVGAIVTTLRDAVVEEVPLVDELVVVDTGSADDTVAVATEAGARVVSACGILPELGHRPGKGEALWKSQFVTSGDIVVFLDSDLIGVGPHYVTGLVGPLLDDPAVSFVKAFFDRPVNGEGSTQVGGGRVTELVARPLLNLYWPELSGVIQPLSGQCAGRRSTLERLPFAGGYGVEIAMLLDTFHLVGLDGIAQVDLGHLEQSSHQSVGDLGFMAATIMHTALRRSPVRELVPSPADLTQFSRLDGRQEELVRPVPTAERPPARSVVAHHRRMASAGTEVQ